MRNKAEGGFAGCMGGLSTDQVDTHPFGEDRVRPDASDQGVGPAAFGGRLKDEPHAVMAGMREGGLGFQSDGMIRPRLGEEAQGGLGVGMFKPFAGKPESRDALKLKHDPVCQIRGIRQLARGYGWVTKGELVSEG